jgi:hypothetical protein
VANFAEFPAGEPTRDKPDPTAPAGDVYDWYVRGRDLLSSGSAAAAVQILSRTVEAEPAARSAREMLARAHLAAAVKHLALAVAMRADLERYARELLSARADAARR